MKKNKNDVYTIANRRSLVRIILSVVLAAVFCTCLWLFAVSQVSAYEQDFLSVYGTRQEALVQEVAERAEELLSLAGEGHQMEKAAVDRVISRAETNGSCYWIFADEERLLYVQNPEKTLALGEQSLLGLIESYQIQGGENTTGLKRLAEQRENGSALYSISHNNGRQLISFRFFEANGKEYALGMTTTEHYIFAQGNLSTYRVRAYLFTGIVTAAIMILVTAYTILCVNKDRRIDFYTQEIREKNTLIENINRKLREAENRPVHAETIDSLTGVYSREFALAFLDKLSDKRLLPAVVAEICPEAGSGEESRFMKTADIIRTMTTENDIVARDGSGFVLILLQTDGEKVDRLLEKIQKQYEKEFPGESLVHALYRKTDCSLSGTLILDEVKKRLQEKLPSAV